MSVLVVTDADNTLWDTNSVFARAQVLLAQRVCSALGLPSIGRDTLRVVRQIDQRIAVEHAEFLRYPPRILVEALVEEMGGDIRKMSTTIETLAEQFSNNIQSDIPRLRNGVKLGVSRMAANGWTLVIATEGDGFRCRNILERRGIARFFADIICGPKSVEFFRTIRSNYSRLDELFMIGDQPDRDLQFSEAAGFHGILFPGGFRPHWNHWNQLHTENIASRVRRFDDAIEIISGRLRSPEGTRLIPGTVNSTLG